MGKKGLRKYKQTNNVYLSVYTSLYQVVIDPQITNIFAYEWFFIV